MALWLPGDKDFSLVHEDPYPLVLGADPDDYLYDYMREFPLIVNMTGDAGHETTTHAIVMHYSMIDAPHEDLVPPQDRCEAFLRAAHVFASTGPSYWHCAAGINRSGFMVAAYLHLHRGLGIVDAISLLREKRHRFVLSNSMFERTLLERYGT